MRTVTASEAKQALASVIDSVAREPVVIQRQKRDVAVMMSIQEYERLVHLNGAEVQRFCDVVGAPAAEAGVEEGKSVALFGPDGWWPDSCGQQQSRQRLARGLPAR